MARQERARVLRAGGPLEERLGEVAGLGDDAEERPEEQRLEGRAAADGEDDRHDERGDDEAAEHALERLLRRDPGEERPPPDRAPDEVGAGVEAPDPGQQDEDPAPLRPERPLDDAGSVHSVVSTATEPRRPTYSAAKAVDDQAANPSAGSRRAKAIMARATATTPTSATPSTEATRAARSRAAGGSPRSLLRRIAGSAAAATRTSAPPTTPLRMTGRPAASHEALRLAGRKGREHEDEDPDADAAAGDREDDDRDDDQCAERPFSHRVSLRSEAPRPPGEPGKRPVVGARVEVRPQDTRTTRTPRRRSAR